MSRPGKRGNRTKGAASKRAAPADRYELRLYVAGTTSRSIRAIENLRRICEEHLSGRYQLAIIDIYQEGSRLQDEQILAVPTLVKQLPPPLRQLIGDMSDRERVLIGLDLIPQR